jgi:hypothetical protein
MVTRAELYVRATERLTGLTAGLSKEDSLRVLDMLSALVDQARERTLRRR